MNVVVPSPLRSYTDGKSAVIASGATVAELLADLDRRYPGIRFRMIDEQGGIRPHLRFFVNRVQTKRLDLPLAGGDEVQILQSLSGG